MEKILLVDFSWLLYRFHFVKMDLTTKSPSGEQIDTKQVYLFGALVESVLRKKIADKIILCQDLDIEKQMMNSSQLVNDRKFIQPTKKEESLILKYLKEFQISKPFLIV